ncbi:LUC7-related splicing factor homolog [Caenorhabditis elegans]|uniref:LUC7 related splicing factor homolog n=1 Tax=Caenorhabditis elegans TaxID=6239 RepID=G8JXY3_CAEEL|nr:LUC7 related splicing factor homolog [Caenorhabditis elegans]CCD61477.1 LUC7 related splicing factor homolog [Caenorhabditis elegans]|eukprot:NP_741026.1 Uncharacterized protein CELE_B0495.8 [Caenorhabditis elegans]
MTDQMRDMIAQLMGSQHVDNKEKPSMPFDHHSVCRAFLLGVCPHDMVPDSRLQVPPQVLRAYRKPSAKQG